MNRKQFISGVLAAVMCASCLPVASAASVRRDVANSSTQISSPVETVYANAYAGSARTVDFNRHWKFNLGDSSGAHAPSFSDAAWRSVDLPHDYSIEQPFTSSGEAESGYLPGGTGWYRKTFVLSPDWQGKTISIDFGGVYMNATVYLNGYELGSHPYGYTPFSFVLPKEHLKFDGDNVIAVKVDHRTPSSRWYSGSGIYRNVTLTVTEPVHVARHGVTVQTENNGTVTVKTELQNDTAAEQSGLRVRQTVYPKGSDTAAATQEGAPSSDSIPSGNRINLTQTLTVSDPALWSLDAPNLYVLRTEVMQGERVIDTVETTFGFREFAFDQQTGFSLNGEKMKLKGVCMHHDQGALGAEAWTRAIERQVEILKDMGCNAIRVTHNPAAQELIDICNEKGMLVIDEAFDTWEIAKNGNGQDFSKWFNVPIGANNAIVGGTPNMTWAEFDIKAMVQQDKNAPCVIMYSLGNEIFEGLSYYPAAGRYATVAGNLIRWVKEVDATRPTTFGQNNNNDAEATKVAEVIHQNGGVIGLNYATMDKVQNWNAKGWNTYGSETASAVNSRGVYDYKGGADKTGNQRLTSYDKSAVGWGAVASDAWYRTIRADHNAGEFIWTGFDYIGEPTPWNGTGSGSTTGNFEVSPKSSYFGIVETTGFPKDSYYLYQSLWHDDVHTLHVLPTWNQDDLVLEQGKAEVVVYSDAPVVKLYLNGEEVGTATAQTTTTGAGFTYQNYTQGTGTFVQKNQDNHQSLYATFMVPYAAGTLTAKAFEADGTTEITGTEGRAAVETTGEAAKLQVTADAETIQADSKDLCYVTIDVTDAQGRFVNGAEPSIRLSIEGNGKIVGVDNGEQADHTSYQSTTRDAFHGKLLAIVQSTDQAGSFTLTAQADGLQAGSVTVQTQATGTTPTEKTVSSLEYSRTYYVKVGNVPQLPETIQVNYSDGTHEMKQVTWDEPADGSIDQTGTFTLTGKLEGTNLSATVTVQMLDAIAALQNYSAAIAVGAEPNLPATRPAIAADGSVLNAYFPVAWDLSTLDRTQPGVYTVTGTASVFGQEMHPTATVRVSRGEVLPGGNVAPSAVELFYGTDSMTADLAMIRDGETAADSVSWNGQGELKFRYDTAQNLNEVKLYLKDTAPTSREMHLEWSPDGTTWTDIQNPTIENEQQPGMTVRTYRFDMVSAVWVKLAFDKPVQLVEAELKTGMPSFAVGSQAALSALTVKGRVADQSALQAGAFSVPDAEVTADDVQAEGKDNASVTVMPKHGDSILLLLESEDHSQSGTFRILLGGAAGGDGRDPEDAARDYDRTKTTATAPSQQTPASGSEGPIGFAVDGNSNTFWHSKWDENLTAQAEKRYLELTLQEATLIDALRYLPRPTIANGIVTQYRIEISKTESGEDFKQVATGSWAHDTAWKIATFAPTTAKRVRLYGVETRGGNGDTPNKFMSAAEVRVCVAAKDLFADAVITLPADRYDYTGAEICPEPTVKLKDSDTTLQKDTDYTVSYQNNTEPGLAYVIVSGKGAYQGKVHVPFTINEPPADTVETYESVTVYTERGTAPALPGTIKANMASGKTKTFEVAWTQIAPDRYAEFGEFTVEGEVLGQTEKAVATVIVRGALAVEPVALTTVPGVAPELPGKVTVHMSDGKTVQSKVKWDIAQQDFTGEVGDIIRVLGTVEGTELGAAANVRLTEAVADDDNNLALNTSKQDLPLAMAWVSSPGDNPFNALDGNKAFVSTSEKKIWSDWEQNTTHPDPNTNWFGVILGEGDTPAPQTIQKVAVGFMEEDNGNPGSGKVSLPQDYSIQYYVGSEEFSFNANKNGFVREWTNAEELNKAENWEEVTYIGKKPEVPAQDDFKHMVDVPFEPVHTSIIRICFTPQQNDWVGLEEFEVYGMKADDTLYDTFDVQEINLDGKNVLDQFDENHALTIDLGYDPLPVITASATNNAIVTVLPAPNRNGTAQIIFVPENGDETQKVVYEIHFTGAEIPRHIVTFDAQGGSLVSNAEVTHNQTVARPQDDPVREGFRFTGWYTEPECVNAYDFDQPVTASFTLYAGWEAVQTPVTYHTVRFDTHGGSELEAVRVEDGKTIDEPDAPSRSGYRFRGWYLDASYDEAFDFDTAITEDLTLHARWKRKSSGGSSSGSRPSDEDDKPTKPEKPEEPEQPEPEDKPALKPVPDFTDVPEGFWGEDAIEYVVAYGLFNGLSDESFGPHAPMNRAMLWTVLARLDGQDTSGGDTWYTAGQKWAMNNGISDGQRPTDPITREQLAAMLHRFAGMPVGPDQVTGFADAASVSPYARPALAWAIEHGILSGMGNGMLQPGGQATRAQVAVMLMRYCENVAR